MQLWIDLTFGTISQGCAASVTTFLAYLDPGTGSYALQILLATLFGGMFALKQSWAELKFWLRSRFGESPRTSAPVPHSSGNRSPPECQRQAGSP